MAEANGVGPQLHQGGQKCSASAELPLPLQTSEHPTPGGEKVWDTCFELMDAGRVQARLESLSVNSLKTLEDNRIKESSLTAGVLRAEQLLLELTPKLLVLSSPRCCACPRQWILQVLGSFWGQSSSQRGHSEEEKRAGIYPQSWISILHAILTL